MHWWAIPNLMTLNSRRGNLLPLRSKRHFARQRLSWYPLLRTTMDMDDLREFVANMAANRKRSSPTFSPPEIRLQSRWFKAKPFEKIFWRVLGSGERWRGPFPVGGHVFHKLAQTVHRLSWLCDDMWNTRGIENATFGNIRYFRKDLTDISVVVKWFVFSFLWSESKLMNYGCDAAAF